MSLPKRPHIDHDGPTSPEAHYQWVTACLLDELIELLRWRFASPEHLDPAEPILTYLGIPLTRDDIHDALAAWFADSERWAAFVKRAPH